MDALGLHRCQPAAALRHNQHADATANSGSAARGLCTALASKRGTRLNLNKRARGHHDIECDMNPFVIMARLNGREFQGRRERMMSRILRAFIATAAAFVVMVATVLMLPKLHTTAGRIILSEHRLESQLGYLPCI